MRQIGLSLVELLVVIASVGIMVLLIANIPSSINLVNKSRHQSIAREIASKVIEDTRVVTYANLANGQSAINDARLFTLPSGSGTKDIEDCPAEICTNNEDTKQLTVTINWKEVGKELNYVVKTFISSGGLGQ